MRHLSDAAIKDLEKRSDELGDWHATFPGRTPEQVLNLMALQQKQIERLIDERDSDARNKQLTADLAAAQKRVEKLELDLVEKFQNFNTEKDLKRELDVAQKACAEMRELIQQWKPYWPDVNRATHALSLDCGKGWRSPDEYAALEAKLRRLVELGNKAYSNGWPTEQDWISFRQALEALKGAK